MDSVGRKTTWGSWARAALIVVYLFFAVMPGVVFFSSRGGAYVFRTDDLTQFSQRVFPLVGLYAFFFVWAQVMIGANMRWLRRVFGRIETFHRTEGVFVLLFALLHPLLLLIGVGPTAYFARTYVDRSLLPYIWLGYAQLGLICSTAGTALLMKLPWLRRRWHYIHFANYFVFVAVWVHSWFLGTDVRTTVLRFVWLGAAGLYGLSVAGRFWPSRRRVEQPLGSMPPAMNNQAASESYVTVARIGEVSPGQSRRVQVGQEAVALFNVDGRYYALADRCSHAGGPLADGRLDGNIVTCPWHGSQFNVTTGAVVRGPAVRPQATYAVRVRDLAIEVQG